MNYNTNIQQQQIGRSSKYEVNRWANTQQPEKKNRIKKSHSKAQIDSRDKEISE